MVNFGDQEKDEYQYLMNSFICKKCHNEVHYAKGDRYLFEKDEWICPNCKIVIAEKNYPVNLKGETTIFTAIGDNKCGVALGDATVFEVVKRKYLEDNPDENVIFLDPYTDHVAEINRLKPAKVFLCEFYRNDTYLFDRDAIRYRVMNEVKYFNKFGIYPQLEYEPEKPEVELPDRYVVMHVRNIEKVPERPNPKRNLDPETAEILTWLIWKHHLKIVIVGNDTVNDRLNEYEFVTDLRNKLTLPEIAWILKRGLLYVGRDSGLVHVAAACGIPIVAWNFNGKKWFPNMPEIMYTAIEERESTLPRIITEIENKIKEIKNG